MQACGVFRALPCDDWSLRNLFKLKGTIQQLKMAKKSILQPFWTPNPIFWPFWAAEWVPGVCHVMSGPYATFSNPRDPISGSEWPKSQFFGPFWTQNSMFGHFELLSGSLEFETSKLMFLSLKRLRKDQSSHGNALDTHMPIFWREKIDQKMGCGVQNGRKIDFLKKFLKFLVLQGI